MSHNGVPGHDHSQCSASNGECFSLYSHINRDELVCLNEKENHSIKTIFKSFDLRADKSDVVESDADEQLIIHIPFHGVVKLKSFVIVGGGGGSCPSAVKLFINRDDIDFAAAEQLRPVQEFLLAEGDVNGDLEYPVQVTKFANCSSITMFIPGNFGAPNTRIHFIGLKGEFTPMKRGPVHATYELIPAAEGSKTAAETSATQSIL